MLRADSHVDNVTLRSMRARAHAHRWTYLNTDGGARLQAELVLRETRQQITLTHTAVTDQHDCTRAQQAQGPTREVCKQRARMMAHTNAACQLQAHRHDTLPNAST